MSEYETTDLGGDPVEFEFVEGGTYERGVIRSTADRQQIRRDAEEELSGESRMSYKHAAELLARHCLALLTELEQAEWLVEQLKRSEGKLQKTLADFNRELREAEARLANVAALVEAAKAASTAVKMAATIEGIDFAVPYLDEALAAWEKQ